MKVTKGSSLSTVRQQVIEAYVVEYERHLFEPFTDRQREIVVLVCSGISTLRKLGTVLGIDPRTVERHLGAIYERTGIEGDSIGKQAVLVSEVAFRYHPPLIPAVALGVDGSHLDGVDRLVNEDYGGPNWPDRRWPRSCVCSVLDAGDPDRAGLGQSVVSATTVQPER